VPVHADVAVDASGGESAQAVDATVISRSAGDMLELRRAAMLGRAGPAGVLALQRAAGNRAVAAALGAGTARLMIQRAEKQEGEPGRRPDLWVGDTGPAVKLLQARLAIEKTGQFDEATRLAVVQFRKDVFKEADPAGGVGATTWQKLDERAGAKPLGEPGSRPNLWVGDSGPAVVLLQRILNIPRTGVFDEKTRLEVVQFRKAAFKEPDPAGGVGPETWKALEVMATEQADSGLCGGWHPCCASGDCDKPDWTTAGGGGWEINVAIDLEVAAADDVTRKGEVGHAWVEFKGADGKRWSYGFYNDPTDPHGKPDPFFHPKVKGCIVHPDRIHEACVDRREKHTVTEDGYQKALALAQATCRTRPEYDLKDLNCTTFVARIIEAAGGKLPNYRSHIGGTGGTTADNPYALVDSLDKDVPTHALTDADKIHEWLQKHPDDIAALPETEKKRLIRKALDRTWIRDKDLEAVEMVCNRVTDAAEMMRIQHEIVPLVNKMNSPWQRERLLKALARQL
jgi:peptidoglycan hydrolase-like protein with peptidoglycan-binding domain